jgi:hypothetical protein
MVYALRVSDHAWSTAALSSSRALPVKYDSVVQSFYVAIYFFNLKDNKAKTKNFSSCTENRTHELLLLSRRITLAKVANCSRVFD